MGTSYQVLGTGSVSFVDNNQSQHSIPLSLLSISGGTVSAASWPPYGTYSAIVDPLLAQLVAEGVLTAGTTAVNLPAPPAPVLTITATAPGSQGDTITVTFSNPQPSATPPTVDVTVSATEVYTGLTLATVATAAGLGSSATTATGMLFVNGAVNSMPVAQSGPMGGDFQYLLQDAANSAAGAFSVEATVQTPDVPTNMSVAITIPASAPAGQFMLTATYQPAAPATYTLAQLLATPNPFAALVTFTGSAASALPAAGAVTLGGGSSPSPATGTALSA